MPSRRSRRAQQGTGGDDQLAKLAAMKEIMGDPLKDLMGLMTLQRAIDQGDQMRKDEARASRQEALAAAKAASDEQAAYRTYSLNYDVAKANFALAQAKGKLEEAGTMAEIKQGQDMVAQRQREVDVKVKDYEHRTGSLPHPEVAKQAQLLAVINKWDPEMASYEAKTGKVRLAQLMADYGYDRETRPNEVWKVAQGDVPEEGTRKGVRYWWDEDYWNEHTEEFDPPPPKSRDEVREALDNTNPGRRYDLPNSLDILRSENTSL